ncbi:hypothetical protein BOX15_Mlig030659g1 [Macrostomum lignano]|uniref:Uncharacterized protein n=2 Tax=Macrostomum lignano TaxID=282301 RepID=A0A267G155_9PLAT|nr:hypothetical protein BOX15_Mlig023412g1 [Macrostomum lignano]PAA79835.1 hypothetical protein BOX15_Mlig030659g1 [Macrostomum lignano]
MQAPMPTNLMRVVKTDGEDGQSSTRVEPLPFVVYGRMPANDAGAAAASAGPATTASCGQMVNGRPVTPLDVYFPGKRSNQANGSCSFQRSSQPDNSGDQEKFMHSGAGFSSTSQSARCHFIVHPDWVSEKRRGPDGMKGGAGAQQVSSRGLQYGSG